MKTIILTLILQQGQIPSGANCGGDVVPFPVIPPVPGKDPACVQAKKNAFMYQCLSIHSAVCAQEKVCRSEALAVYEECTGNLPPGACLSAYWRALGDCEVASAVSYFSQANELIPGLLLDIIENCPDVGQKPASYTLWVE